MTPTFDDLHELDQYIADCYECFEYTIRKEEEIDMAYQIWAVNEMYSELAFDDRDISVVEKIEDFIKKMDTWACDLPSGDRINPFSVAYDVACEIQNRIIQTKINEQSI